MNHSYLNRFSLKGKIIVITGAAGLLGEQHACAVAEAGGTPILLDIRGDSVTELANTLSDKYEISVVAYTVDITDEEAISRNTKILLERFERIDVLINNAANNPNMKIPNSANLSRLESFPLEAWNADLAVGLTGAFLCAKHYGSAISQNQHGGIIVNIASDLGLIAPDQRLYRQPGLADDQQSVKPVSYSVVKTGLIGLTRYLATYWPDQVRCNALCPGGVEDDQSKDFIDQVKQMIPLGRLAQRDEYKSAIQFLCSEASSYMNGACIVIDGGRTCW